MLADRVPELIGFAAGVVHAGGQLCGRFLRGLQRAPVLVQLAAQFLDMLRELLRFLAAFLAAHHIVGVAPFEAF